MARRQMNVRLSEAGHEWIRKIAEAHGVANTDVVRAALAFAANHSTQIGDIINAKKREM